MKNPHFDAVALLTGPGGSPVLLRAGSTKEGRGLPMDLLADLIPVLRVRRPREIVMREVLNAIRYLNRSDHRFRQDGSPRICESCSTQVYRNEALAVQTSRGA